MLQKRRKPSLKDANRSLPHDLTPTLEILLNQLPSNRRTDYLKEVVFSKFVSSDTAPAKVRRQRAINKWLATERNNEATNVRLMNVHEDFNILPRVSIAPFLAKVTSIITSVIGEVPSEDVLNGSFSGGASTSRVRTQSHPALKYLGIADATPDLVHLVSVLFEDRPLWSGFRQAFDSNVRLVPGNILFTVPKTTEIDRCACKEPDLNMYLQKGIGSFIRSRLRRFGIDLNDQSRNKDLARRGSVSRDLATLDLSSASDSISKYLVFTLLPPLWYTLLNACRSPVTIIDGEEHENEMFSSMGNGFTFELESLIFYAIARAVAYFQGVSGIISVYGDDIICPAEIAEDLVFVLSFLGFETNVSKSFWSGDFRESCGGHYIDGCDVTPFYVRKPITKLIDLIHLANSIRQWAGLDSLRILDPEVEQLWWHFANMVPRQFWGGHDTADKTRLVSYWKPEKEFLLRPVRKTISTGEGGYLYWHDSRGPDGPSANLRYSERVLERNLYRASPVKDYQSSRPRCVFLLELASQPSLFIN